jgi:hypothetical protein
MNRYRVTTWDCDKQAFTPQQGVPCRASGLGALRRTLRKLQECGYSCHRNAAGNDSYILIERI